MNKRITILRNSRGALLCSTISILTVAILFDFVLATSALAYVDPNTGGFFFQTVAPFVYGILGVIVIFWKRINRLIKSLISRLIGRNNSAQDE